VPGLHARRVLRARRPRGVRAAAAAAAELRGARRCSSTIDEYEARLDVRDRDDQADEVPGYFLIVWDFIRYARERGSRSGPGRGSAAGSLVAYCLRITDVDPIEFDLIFERFLNPERVSLPDIDIDFCERRRGEVIEYVTRKYGRENVAQIITFGTMKAKAVVRDVGRVLDMPYAEVDKVAKLIPAALDMTLEKALEESPALPSSSRRTTAVKELLAVGRRLEGMTRHASVHAAGVVIAPRPLTEFAPLYKGPEGRNRHAVGDEGDRARRPPQDGLPRPQHAHAARRRLDEIERTDRDRRRPRRAAARRREDLPAVLGRADATACSSSRARACARRCARRSRSARRPDRAQRAVPARPAQGRHVDDFIAPQARPQDEVKYELPQLEPILRDTYGVIAYQEQVMRIARDLAGFTMGEADVLRKAMGKKDPRSCRRSASASWTARSARHQREEGHEDLRPDGVLRRLRLQQVALDDLRAARLPDRRT
jgi:DNA polymerase III subunit alpha